MGNLIDEQIALTDNLDSLIFENIDLSLIG